MNIPRAISLGLFFLGVVTAQVRPPNFSPDDLPDTSFTCEDKITGGYYADVEAECQLFHVCVQVSEYEFQDFHFLCPNDTVFDQQHLVCANWFEVDCQLHSQQFFPHDFEFDKSNEEEIAYDEYPDYGNQDISDQHDQGNNQNSQADNNPDTQSFLGVSQPSLSSRLHNGGKGQGGSSLNKDREYDYTYDYAYEQDEDARGRRPLPEGLHGVDVVNPSINTTPIPVIVTTSRRPIHTGPRVKSDILQAKRNKNRGKGSKLNKLGNRVETGGDDGRRKFVPFTSRPDLQHDFQDITTKTSFISPFDRPPLISADGKKPRVKSNIQAGQSHIGNSPGKPKKQGSKKVELDRNQLGNINFVEPRLQDHETTEDPFAGPEVRPDGRAPRVKANILAKQQNVGRLSPQIQSPDPITFRPFNVVQPAKPPATIAPNLPNDIFTTRNSNIFTTASPRRPFPTRPAPSINFSSQPPSRPSPSLPPRRPIPPGIQNFDNEPPHRQKNTGIQSFSPGGLKSFSPQPPRRPTPHGIQIFTTESPRRPTPDGLNSFSRRPSSRPANPNIQGFNSPGSRNRFNSLPSSTSPPLTFRPLTLKEQETPSHPSLPAPFDQPSFNSNPPSRPENPPPFQTSPNPSFNLGPPPQPKIPPSLQRNRNRFGTKPRVKANELANRANSGRTRNRFREKVRNNNKLPSRFAVTPAVPFDSQAAVTPAPSIFGSQPKVAQSPPRFTVRTRPPRPRPQFRRPETKHIIKGIGGSAVSNSINNFSRSRKAKDCRSNPFLCPPKIKADGKRPRVKSDIKARKRNFWHPKKKIRKTRKKARDRKFLERRRGRVQITRKEDNNSINEIVDDVKSTTQNPIKILALLNQGKSTTRNPIETLEQLNTVTLGSHLDSNAQTTTEFPSRLSATKRSFRKSHNRFRNKKFNVNKNKSFLASLRRPSVLDNLTTSRGPVVTASTQASIFVTNPNFQHFHEVTTSKKTLNPIDIPSESISPKPQFRDQEINFFPTPSNFPQSTRPTRNFFQQPVTPTRQPFHVDTKPNKLRIEDLIENHEDNTERSEGPIPDSSPTLQSPFTDSDDHLFVTNPRALTDHHRRTFANPPKETADGRKPRVKSNLKAIEQNKPGFFSGIGTNSEEDTDEENQTIPTLKIIPDGRAPRVKSDIKNKRKPKKKFFTRIGNRRKGKGLNLELDSLDDSINDITPSLNRDEEGPEVRPDGRMPRVKSDIKAKKAHVGKLIEKKNKQGFRHSQKVPVISKNRLTLKNDRKSEINNEQNNTRDNEINTDDSDHKNKKSDLSVTTSRTHVLTTISSRDDESAPITTFRPKFDFGSIGTFRTTKEKRNKPIFNNHFIAESSTIRNSVFDGEKRTQSKPSPATDNSVPLPNINISPPHSERFAQAVFEPTPKGFAQREQVFSDFPRTTLLGGLPKLKMKPTPESATEIIRVSKKDRQLFDNQYYYDYYYYEDHPF